MNGRNVKNHIHELVHTSKMLWLCAVRRWRVKNGSVGWKKAFSQVISRARKVGHIYIYILISSRPLFSNYHYSSFFRPSKTGLPPASLTTLSILLLSFGSTRFKKTPITAATMKGVSTMRLIPYSKPGRWTLSPLWSRIWSNQLGWTMSMNPMPKEAVRMNRLRRVHSISPNTRIPATAMVL